MQKQLEIVKQMNREERQMSIISFQPQYIFEPIKAPVDTKPKKQVIKEELPEETPATPKKMPSPPVVQQ